MGGRHMGQDQVFAWLDKAYQQRAGWLAWYLLFDPEFEGLRSDPRYANFARRIGLAPRTPPQISVRRPIEITKDGEK